VTKKTNKQKKKPRNKIKQIKKKQPNTQKTFFIDMISSYLLFYVLCQAKEQKKV